MAAVTVNDRLEIVGPLAMEVVRVTADDGDTYESRFATVVYAHFTPDADSSASNDRTCTISGGTITFNLTGATTDVTGGLLIFGK